ncbi:glycosyltransferase [Lacinutrix sp. Hel_I_90]|uniref:glycosyltransferase n=1 Tax=Lacinutrix sp. Hel_I_90 TaxID=1249999 RepID=UPI0005CAE032|nr:glycosyltransferase [Lacinutrix sp. Hel_I_90]
MKKICVVTTSLSKGGAEKSSAILTQLLVKLNYEVHILMTKDDLDYDFSGTLFNLEKEYGNELSQVQKSKILRTYFQKQQFDVIIDNRTRAGFFKEFILYHFIFKAKEKIAVVRSFYLRNYLPRHRFQAKLIYGNSTTLVAVSKGIEKAIHENYSFKNVKQIYNPVDVNIISEKAYDPIEMDTDFILWYGRIAEQVKNLTLLLEAFKTSNLPENHIKLCIIGQGEDVGYLKEKIRTLDLEAHVHYIPFLKNPFSYVIRAKFTVLTSYYEGFPRVLIESLACGTPVISVDCNSGPNEIIIHKYNGLLVENHDIKALANAFNTFIQNTSLYNSCKSHTTKSIDKFTYKKIGSQWQKLIDALKT